jgi:hypothetical protein
MGYIARCLFALLFIVIAVPAFSDDQQKARKECNKVTAMATDATGRGVVNLSMAELLGVKRLQLVQERHDTGLNYGALFIAHELSRWGAKMEEIGGQLKQGKNIFQIANDVHTNWKEIADSAKKLNSSIDKNLYKHFLHEKAAAERDKAENYNVVTDGVVADNDVSQEEIEQAQNRYLLWLNQTGAPGKSKGLGEADEKAAYYDHVRSGGPHGSAGNSGGATAPAAGGIPQ